MSITIKVIDRVVGEETISFDESFNETYNYVKFTDYRLKSPAWYYMDYSKIFHPDRIRGDIDGVVEDSILINAGETIIDNVGKEVGLDLSDDPLEARNNIKRYLTDDLTRLRQVIYTLEQYSVREDVSGAWAFLQGAPQKFTNGIPNKLRDLLKYVEIAIFFYIVGSCGHSIQWAQ
jgi:hypothetical protein